MHECKAACGACGLPAGPPSLHETGIHRGPYSRASGACCLTYIQGWTHTQPHGVSPMYLLKYTQAVHLQTKPRCLKRHSHHCQDGITTIPAHTAWIAYRHRVATMLRTWEFRPQARGVCPHAYVCKRQSRPTTSCGFQEAPSARHRDSAVHRIWAGLTARARNLLEEGCGAPSMPIPTQTTRPPTTQPTTPVIDASIQGL